MRHMLPTAASIAHLPQGRVNLEQSVDPAMA
jgi:hypothetical protein